MQERASAPLREIWFSSLAGAAETAGAALACREVVDDPEINLEHRDDHHLRDTIHRLQKERLCPLLSKNETKIRNALGIQPIEMLLL